METTNNTIVVSNATACCIEALRMLTNIKENYRTALADLCDGEDEAEDRFSLDNPAFLSVEKVLAKALNVSIFANVESHTAMI